MYSHPSTAGFSAQLDWRLRRLWVPKAIGMTLGMTAFFVVYFQLLNHPVFPVAVMPLIAVDRWITFQPAALPLYLSLWFYVSLVPALLVDTRELANYALAAATVAL
ncbi:MAG TPA: hypothetical protein VFJ90_01245, partial [Candidatus Didemnitutus sp.]|nr:hypothetical protein [Candidatus Didemnitutus sp.]